MDSSSHYLGRQSFLLVLSEYSDLAARHLGTKLSDDDEDIMYRGRK